MTAVFSMTGRLGIRAFIIYAVLFAAITVRSGATGSKYPAQEYRFTFGEYELLFSVPKALQLGIYGKPDRYDPDWRIGLPGEDSSATYFFHIYMFRGPIWVGNYASLEIVVQEIEAAAAYEGPVSTLEELEEYLSEKFKAEREWARMYSLNSEPPEVSRKTISGYTWIQTIVNPTQSARTGKRGAESNTLRFPLGNRRYLMVLCQIDELVPNKTRRWLTDAHAMRDYVMNSVVLRKKAN
ncbi:MAG: hypothetical protein R3F03_05565 [Opitutaceae bacterium]